VHAQAILAIDLGTSGPKVALVTRQGTILGSAFEPTPLHLLPDGGAEQDPHDWWRALKSATARLLAAHPGAGAAVAAVCATGQWSGTVAVDADGQPLMNAVIWMDARGAPHVRATTGGRLRVAGYGPLKLCHWLRLTGGIPAASGKDPLAHILYIRERHPEVYARTRLFLEPKDYLNLKLTGRPAASWDSITLHWVTDNRRIQAIDYHPRLLALAGLPREKLPPLKRAVDILGPLTPEAAGDLGLPPGLPVVMGTPDIQSAAIGCGGVADYTPHLYIGTSAWLTCHVPFKKTDIRRNMASLPAAVPGRYFVANEQETAGACLTFLKDRLLKTPGTAEGLSYAELDGLAAQAPPGSGGLVFTPWLYGERTPVENAAIRGGFHNLSLEAGPEHIARAVLEGVACNARWLLAGVESFVKRRLPEIRLVGGGARSALWCQIFADVLDREILQMADPLEVNLRGAGMLAAAALGWEGLEALARRVPVAGRHLPQLEHRKLYDGLFREFGNLYRAHRPICARLNRRRTET
jgi:xylulokinase